jgi:hypothetical protein
MTRDGVNQEISDFGAAADKILRPKDLQLK